MPKTKIDVKAIVEESKQITQQLKGGIINSTFTKEEHDNISKELEDAINLAEQIKADIPENSEDVKHKKAS